MPRESDRAGSAKKETRILGEARRRVKPGLSRVHSVPKRQARPAERISGRTCICTAGEVPTNVAVISAFITVTKEQEPCACARGTESAVFASSFAPAKGDFMSKRFITLLIIAAAPLLAQQPQQNPPPFGEKVDVNLVQLDAIVTDSRGNQMLGLGKDDFVVRENGQSLPVDSVDYFTNRRLINAPESAAAFKVERVHDERYLIFFFDKITSDFGSQAEMIRARRDAARFLDDRLRPEDRVAIVGHDVRLKIYSDFTSDKEKIHHALNDATAYGLGIRTKDTASTGPSILRNMDIDRMINKTGSVYEALDLLGDALRPIPARKDVVIFSNGIIGPDEDVRGGLVMSRSRYYDPMIESLNSADVTLYPVSLQSGVTEPEYVHQNLASMASDTNGQYYRLHTSYISPLKQIEKKTAGYYLISYYTKKRPGEHGFQKVSVALRNPEFKVSARSGYSYGD